MKVLCVIPARSGSKSVPDKNIRLLSGKPVIVYSIETAKQCKYKPKVVVGTDSKEYAKIAQKYGAEVVIEPGDLGGSVYSVINTLKQLSNEGYKPDIVVMLHPTSPLREVRHINHAIEMYLERKEGSVVSVTETKEPYYIRKIEEDKLIPYQKLGKNLQRQELKTYYKVNGAIYVSSPEFLLKHETFHHNPVYPYIMGEKYSIDINEPLDFEIAEALMGGKDVKKILDDTETWISTKELISKQFRDGIFNRMDIVVRYLAFEELHGLNNYGIGLYKKMQELRAVEQQKKSRGVEPVLTNPEVLYELSESMREKGHIEPLVVDQDFHLLDGSHRLACDLFLGIDKIPVKIEFTDYPVYYSKKWFENKFTREELKLIQAKKDEIFLKMGLYFTVCLWSPAYPFFEEITSSLSKDYRIISVKDCNFTRYEFEAAVKGIYAIDDVKGWQVAQKLEFMRGYPPKLRVIGIEIKEPKFGFKNSGSFISEVAEEIKRKYRGLYKYKIQNYFHDISIHVGDNFKHTEHIEKLLNKDIDVKKFLDSIKEYEYALCKTEVPYMPGNFPLDYPLGKDIDVLCTEKDFTLICAKAKFFALDYSYRVKKVFKGGHFLLRLGLGSAPGKEDFLCFQIDVSICPDEVIKRRRWKGYYVLGEDDERRLRLQEYLKSPEKKYHLEYYLGRNKYEKSCNSRLHEYKRTSTI